MGNGEKFAFHYEKLGFHYEKIGFHMIQPWKNGSLAIKTADSTRKTGDFTNTWIKHAKRWQLVSSQRKNAPGPVCLLRIYLLVVGGRLYAGGDDNHE